MDSRYQATSAPIYLAQRAPGPAWLGVLVGLLTEWGASFALLLLAIAQSLLAYLDAGLSEQEAVRTVTYLSPYAPLYMIMTFIGLVFSVLGGLVGARLARRTHCWPGVAHAAVSAALTLRFTSAPERPGVMAGIAAALAFLCVLLGAWLGRERTVR
jgi:hypothetical protein